MHMQYCKYNIRKNTFMLTCLIAYFAIITWYTVKAANRLPSTDSLPGTWMTACTADRHWHLGSRYLLSALHWMCRNN